MLKKISQITLIILFLFGLFCFWAIKSVDKVQIINKVEKKLVYKPEKETLKLIPELAKKAEEKSFTEKDGTKIEYLRIMTRESLRFAIVFSLGWLMYVVFNFLR